MSDRSSRAAARAGRRARVNLWDPLTIGIDIGGTKILAGVVDSSGNVVELRRRPTLGHDVVGGREHDRGAGPGAPAAVRRRRGRHRRRRVRRRQPVDGDVLAAPGLARRAAARPAGRAGSRSRSSWTTTPTPPRWARAGSAPAPVTAFVLVRHARAPASAARSSSTGGSSAARNGMAGEFGHMQVVPDGHRCPCGQPRLLGAVRLRQRPGARGARAGRGPLAGRAPARARSAAGDPEQLIGPLITEAAQEGDPLSIELLADVGRWLGIGVAELVAAFDPDCVIVGGGVSDAGDLLLGPTRESMLRVAGRPRLPRRSRRSCWRGSARRPGSSAPRTWPARPPAGPAGPTGAAPVSWSASSCASSCASSAARAGSGGPTPRSDPRRYSRAPSSQGSMSVPRGILHDEVDEAADERRHEQVAQPRRQVDAEHQADQQHRRRAEQPRPGQEPVRWQPGQRRGSRRDEARPRRRRRARAAAASGRNSRSSRSLGARSRSPARTRSGSAAGSSSSSTRSP